MFPILNAVDAAGKYFNSRPTYENDSQGYIIFTVIVIATKS